MRHYIRHPTSIPIHVKSSGNISCTLTAEDLSAGGLRFMTTELVSVGDVIDFKISMVNPDYQGRGVVVWCRKRVLSEFEVGLRFTSNDEYFRTRMVEQVCQIEEYRQHVAEKDGRTINTNEAALEWIAKYAKDFNGEDE